MIRHRVRAESDSLQRGNLQPVPDTTPHDSISRTESSADVQVMIPGEMRVVYLHV